MSIFDSGETDGRLFLAMRLVRGGTLADRMRAGGLSGEQAITILTPIADALDAAHAAGIIHRDIKPQNILITTSGHPYLADFGIAKGTTTAGFTAAGDFVGSANYAAPEQILGHTITQAVDIYALAVVVYQCLTGQVPYPRDTDAGVLYAHVNAPAPSIPSDQPGADRFNEMMARGMAKLPEARLDSAGALLALAADVIDRVPPPMRQLSPTFQSTTEPTAAESRDRATVDQPPARNGGAIEAATPRRRAAIPANRGRGPRVLIAAVLLALAGAAVALLAIAGESSAHKRVARSGPLSITYPNAWRHQPISAQLRTLFNGVPIQLVDGTVELGAGTLRRSAAVPGGPPPTLTAAYGTPTEVSSTTVAGAPGREYQWSTPTGLLAAFVLPLADGDAAVVCRASVTADQCAALASRAVVQASQVLPPGPNQSLARAIDAAVAPVAAARQRLGTLSEPTLAARATAAAELARADDAAASGLAKLNIPARYRAPVGQLRSALLSEARRLSLLATDARGGHRHAYAAAVRYTDAASESVAAATRALKSASLAATRLNALRLAPLPGPAAPPTSTTTTSSSTSFQSTSSRFPIQTVTSTTPTEATTTPTTTHVTVSRTHSTTSTTTSVGVGQ